MDDEFMAQLLAENEAVKRITAELGDDREQALRAAFQAGPDYERQAWAEATVDKFVDRMVDQITREDDDR